jgi:hypothetical protein
MECPESPRSVLGFNWFKIVIDPSRQLRLRVYFQLLDERNRRCSHKLNPNY